MSETICPILRVADAEAAATWYARIGFVEVHRHRFEPGFPLYVILRRGEDVWLHLSEHEGDAPPGSLVYLWVDDVDAIADELGVPVEDQPWAREVEVTDPDGNRLRIGRPTPT